MPILHVTTWPNLGDAKSCQLIEALTQTMHSVTGAPLDRITVFITEVPRERWGEGGVPGSHPQFAELSRRGNA